MESASSTRARVTRWVNFFRECDWRSLIGFVLAFSPAIYLGILIDQYSVNVPMWDGWEMVPLLEKAREGTLTFADLYAPHISHRMVFPRLAYLAVMGLADGDLRALIAMNFVVGLLAALGVLQLARQTVYRERPVAWGVIFLVNLLIFSPLQWQNWLWAMQLAFLLPMTCAIWALVVVHRREMSWGWRLLLAGMLALIGSHSFGHGIFIWPAVLGLALCLPEFDKRARGRWAFVGGWLLVGGVVLGCYFGVDFKNVSHESHAYFQPPGEDPPMKKSVEVARENPEKAWDFFRVMVGSPYARGFFSDPMRVAPNIGVILLIAFVPCLIGLLVRRKEMGLWGRAVPWLALGGMVLCSQVAITLARVGYGGLNRGSVIRYFSISLYFAVALIFIVALLWWGRDRIRRTAGVGVALVAGLAGVQLVYWSYGIEMMKLWRVSRYEQQAALMFIDHWDPQAPHRIDATAGLPRQYVGILERYDYLEPRLVKSLELSQFKPADRPMPKSRGQVESLEVLRTGQIKLSGYAKLGPPDYRPADGVLLTWKPRREGAKATIFAMAEPVPKPFPRQYHFDLEYTGRQSLDPEDFNRWEIAFDRERIPYEGDVLIQAWGFDVSKSKAYPIEGAWRLDADGQRVARVE